MSDEPFYRAGEQLTALEISTRQQRNDPTMYRLISTALHHARSETGLINPNYADEDAHRFAEMACQVLFALMRQDGAGLEQLILERDAYKKLATENLSRTAHPMFLVAPVMPEIADRECSFKRPADEVEGDMA